MLVRFIAPAIVAASMLFASSSANAGWFLNAGCGCDAAPSCGCEVAPAPAPTCGCEVVDPCCGPKFGGKLKGLISKLHARHAACGCDAAPSCCDAAPAPTCCAPAPAPTCCDAAPVCDPCARPHHLKALIGRLHSRIHSSSCCEPAPSCGCDAAPACSSCGN